LPEIVEEGKTGFLVRSEEEGVEAVGKIGSLSRVACRKAAEEKFSADVCAQAYLRAYDDVMHS
jgi:glycosyltransferase involved in cell wall biosynthesis